ncbi:hypothetical protein [Hymenobacter chitinivorans]|uniref:hypothetical protein n=1 Tax=Hymenobacter chitinivorans TaxID=89969 RepID=UPI000C23BD45|nr:hypothetical protein [Hymenobacter chitinivorans]
MDKLVGEYYSPILYTIWVVSVPMAIKGEYGFVPSLCAAVLAAGVALLLLTVTVNKPKPTRLLTLIGSGVAIIGFMALVVTPVEPASTSAQTIQAE